MNASTIEKKVTPADQNRAEVTRRGLIGGAAAIAAGAALAGTAVADEAAPEGIAPAIGHINHVSLICSGCRTCEIICTLGHEGVINPLLSRNTVHTDIQAGDITHAYYCQQCDDPKCLKACPTGALHVDPDTGARVIDQDVCIGCQSCLNACPATPSRVRYCLDTNTCFKCDLCGGDPQCVKFCPTGALTATWMDISTESEDDKFFQVDLTGEARTFAHVETNTLELTEQTGGFTLDGVLWTSHATQFNIILALFDVTADFYGADGQLLGSTDNAAHIEISEMQSAEFSLTWTTDLTLADIDHVVVNVPGEYQTNAPGQEG